MIEISRCTRIDIKEMRGKLRQQDVIEIRKRCGLKPYTALVNSFKKSTEAYVARIDGEIACAWGVGGGSILGDTGLIWLLSTEIMEKNPVKVAIKTKIELRKLLCRYSKLENVVDAEYTSCIRWLKWLGFIVEKPKPIGVNNELFSYFSIQ